MAQREMSVAVVAPDAGIVYGSPRHTLPDRAWWRVSNAVFSRGAARKVRGYKLFQTLDSAVMGLTTYERPGQQPTWVAVTKAKVWAKGPNDSTFQDVTGATSLTGGDDDFVSFAQFRRDLIITNGKDPIKKWSGSGTIANLGGNPPKAKRAAILQNHVVLAWLDPGTAQEKPQTLAWSEIGNHEIWSGGLDTGQLTLSDEPTGIIEIIQLRDALVAYKPNAVYLVEYTGFPFTMSTRRLATGVGPLSSRVVVNAQDSHYFLAGDLMVYKLTMAGPEPIGQAVIKLISSELNFSYAHRSYAYWDPLNEEIVFVVPTGGSSQPNVAYVLYVREQRWGRRDLASTAAASVRSARVVGWDDVSGDWNGSGNVWDDPAFSSGTPISLHGDYSGKVYIHDGTLSAAGSPVRLDLETKFFDLGDATKKKRLKRLYVHYEAPSGGSLQVYVLTAASPGSPVSQYGPYTMSLDPVTGESWVDLDVTATWFAFRFVNEDLERYVSITGYVPVFHVREVA